MIKATFWVVTKKGNAFEMELPAKHELCPRCEGRGSHVNPAIDENGINPQEFIDDPEFEENYFGGLYDVACYECKGLRVITVPDKSRLTEKMKDRVERHEQIEADERTERAHQLKYQY